MLLDPSLAAVATGQRISYVSSNAEGTHIVVTGAILTPRTQTQSKQDVVAWAHGTEGLADHCAPSRFAALSSDPTFPLYAATVKSLLDQGWTVAATDYAGLGSPGPHPYLDGPSEGRAIIDSVRAARQLDRSLSPDWVAMGHSQGGQGALFAGEQVRDYGRGLNLRGVVGTAAASNLDQLAAAIVGTPGQGYLVMALSGLAAVDPTVHPEQLMAPPALSRLGVLESGCFVEIIGGFADFTAEELVVGGALPVTSARSWPSAILANVAAMRQFFCCTAKLTKPCRHLSPRICWRRIAPPAAWHRSRRMPAPPTTRS